MKKFLIPIFVIVIVLATYSAWQWRQARQSDQNNTVTEQIPVDKSDWQTYYNEQYGYQINYPATWKAGEEQRANLTRATFTNEQGQNIFHINTPPLETGYEMSISEVDEYIVINGVQLHKLLLVPNPEYQQKGWVNDLPNILIHSWKGDEWKDYGEIFMAYQPAETENVRQFETILQTFRLTR